MIKLGGKLVETYANVAFQIFEEVQGDLDGYKTKLIKTWKSA